jgi:hypothetical protein
MPYIGYKTETSLRRNRIQVQGNFYLLPDVNVIDKLKNARLTAYHLPQISNEPVKTVFIYQNEDFICEAELQDAFQQAKAEQTPEDITKLHKQLGYIKAMDAKVKKGVAALMHLGISEAAKEREEEEFEEILMPKNAQNGIEKGGFDATGDPFLQGSEGEMTDTKHLESIARAAL